MCFEFDALPPDLPEKLRVAPISGGAAAESLTLTAADGTEFSASLAECPTPSEPAVIICPDVRGLYRFYVELAERFVEAGHHAITFDYFGRTAGTGERDEEFDFMSHIPGTSPQTVQQEIAAARDALAERTGAQEFITVGFCFGGAHSFLAATNAELGLSGAIGFYGTLDGSRIGPIFPSPIEHGTETKVPVLGLFGGDDEYIPAEDIARFDEQLSEAGVEHEVRTYEGAPHSFFDRAFEQFADESADAWERVIGFIDNLPAKVAG